MIHLSIQNAHNTLLCTALRVRGKAIRLAALDRSVVHARCERGRIITLDDLHLSKHQLSDIVLFVNQIVTVLCLDFVRSSNGALYAFLWEYKVFSSDMNKTTFLSWSIRWMRAELTRRDTLECKIVAIFSSWNIPQPSWDCQNWKQKCAHFQEFTFCLANLSIVLSRFRIYHSALIWITINIGTMCCEQPLLAIAAKNIVTFRTVKSEILPGNIYSSDEITAIADSLVEKNAKAL